MSNNINIDNNSKINKLNNENSENNESHVIRYLAKRIRKYVIATLDIPTLYLQSLHLGRWQFIDNIEAATKTYSKSLANQLIKSYYIDTGTKVDMVAVPIDVTYEIIQEEEL